MSKLIKCRVCGNKISSSAKMCPKCGENRKKTRKSEMSKLVKCKVCNSQVSSGASECPNCGEPNFHIKCSECDGTGFIYTSEKIKGKKNYLLGGYSYNDRQSKEDCPFCDGKGYK